MHQECNERRYSSGMPEHVSEERQGLKAKGFRLGGSLLLQVRRSWSTLTMPSILCGPQYSARISPAHAHVSWAFFLCSASIHVRHT